VAFEAPTVLVRWTGNPSCFQDPGVRRAIANGALPLPVLEQMRRYEYRLRVSLSPGSERILNAGAGGFSRGYLFTPEAPYQWMTPADAALLLGNPWERWEFIDATDPGHRQRAPLTKDQWRQLLADFAKLAPATGFYMGADKEMRLRGLAGAYR